MTTHPHPKNAWLSWKRVRRAPGKLGLLARLTTTSGRPATLAVSDNSSDYPALWVRDDHSGDTLRIGLQTLVESVLCSEAREADAWQPLQFAATRDDGDELYGNALLTATKRTYPDGTVVLSYHWRDRAPIRDWRVGQRVKNELVHPEAEAIELYPAESRLMDEANEYWLIVYPPDHPAHALIGAMGNDHRSVMTQAELDAEAEQRGESGAVQRDDDGMVLR